jgi:hypothetical protein
VFQTPRPAWRRQCGLFPIPWRRTRSGRTSSGSVQHMR